MGQIRQLTLYHYMTRNMADSNSTELLVSRSVQGDTEALSTLMDRYRSRLNRMVGLRMDRRLQGRVGASDVVQEALIEAARRLADYQRDPPMGFFLWLRALTADRLLQAHRRHVGPNQA